VIEGTIVRCRRVRQWRTVDAGRAGTGSGSECSTGSPADIERREDKEQ